MKAEKILSVRHLYKQFAGHRVIDDLSFDLGWNERLALFAPSGSGKTTLINILAGLEPYDGGSFTLQESAPVTIFQEPRLFPYLTVEENIFLPFKVQKQPIPAAIWSSYHQWLEVCRLLDCVKQYPYQLSGGMKQKVALVRGLLGQPRFVMMDEPFQSIDRESKRAIMAHLQRAYPQTALLFVTHQAEEIPEIAQSVLYFQSPRLWQASILDTAAFQAVLAAPTIFVNHRTEICAA
jgi:NitT/TauT family transport system ATP-binding protein